MDQSQNIDIILRKYIQEEQLTEDESIFLRQWLQTGEGREEMIEKMKNDTSWLNESLKITQQVSQSRIRDIVLSRIEQDGHWISEENRVPPTTLPRSRTTRYSWLVLAAIVVVLAIAGVIFWIFRVA